LATVTNSFVSTDKKKDFTMSFAMKTLKMTRAAFYTPRIDS